MDDYSNRLRMERRFDLAVRTLPSDAFNEYGEVFAVTKKEGPDSFPASDYAYVPDSEKPSTWKLRLTSTPGGSPDPQIVGAAIAALGKGFRGNKVQIPETDLAAVKSKVKAAWIKANPEKNPKKDMPMFVVDSIVACGDDDDDDDLKISLNVNGFSETPNLDIMTAVTTLINATMTAYRGYDVKCDFDIDVDQNESDPTDDYEAELDIDLDGKSQTPSDAIKASFLELKAVIQAAYGPKFDLDVDIDVDSVDSMGDDSQMLMVNENNDSPIASLPYDYNLEDIEELGTLPPALKAALVKKLSSLLAKETDPAKKAALQAKIKKYS